MTTRHEVHSSFVRSVEYDPDTKHATVHLAGGSFRFHGVPQSDVTALVSSQSVGTHFNKVFKAVHGKKGKRV